MYIRHRISISDIRPCIRYVEMNTYDVVCVTYDVVCSTYDVVCWRTTSYVTYDIARTMSYVYVLYIARTTSYVRCLKRCRMSHVRCRTCMTCDIVRATYDIVLYIIRTMSYVRYTGYRRTTSYVRYRTSRTMSHVNTGHRMWLRHIRHHDRTFSSPHIVYNVVRRKWTYDVVRTWHKIS